MRIYACMYVLLFFSTGTTATCKDNVIFKNKYVPNKHYVPVLDSLKATHALITASMYVCIHVYMSLKYTIKITILLTQQVVL